MSQNNLPARIASVEKLIQRVSAAEKSQQKEIRISIQEARDLIQELAVISSKLGQTLQEINQNLAELKKSNGNIDVKFDGGTF